MVDTAIVLFVNGFAHKSVLLDHLIDVAIGRPLVKAGLFAGLLWYLWFRDDSRSTRERLLATIAAACVALVLARALALSLPFRVRPLHDSTLAFTPPFGIEAEDLIDWSSFPSDHAALFFALATGIFVVSRRWGIVALLFATFIVCLPRLYAGYHWPSDLLAGAAIGIASGAMTASTRIAHAVAALPLAVWRAKPEIFYTLYFFVTFEIANNLKDLRDVARDAYKLLALMLHH